MKRFIKFLICIAAASCVTAGVTAGVYAETVTHIDSRFGANAGSWVNGNIDEGITGAVSEGVFGKESEDMVYEISAEKATQTNPHSKFSKSVEASDNQYLRIRASFASGDFSQAKIGLAGKMIYKTADGTRAEGFLDNGTASINIVNSELYCYGTKVEGVKLNSEQFYTIDMIVSIGESVDNTLDVYVNGEKVADDIYATEKLASNEQYQILGYVDVRLNISCAKNAAFDAYFDDILVQTADSEEEFLIQAPLAGSVNIGTDGVIKGSDVLGMSCEEIISCFEPAENTVVEIINRIGVKVPYLTKKNYVRYKGEDITYIYAVEEAEQESDHNTYYTNTMDLAFAGGSVVSGVGGKDETDKSAKLSAAANAYFDGKTIGDDMLVIDYKFYADDKAGTRSIEAVSKSGIFAKLMDLTTDGKIKAGAPLTEMGSFNTGEWVKITAVVKSDLSFDYYINGIQSNTNGLKFSNNASDTNTYDYLARFKITVNSPLYIDDLSFTIAKQYPYKEGIPSWLGSQEYLIDEDGIVYIETPNITAGEMLSSLYADDRVYFEDKENSDVLGFDSVVFEVTDAGEIAHSIKMLTNITDSKFYEEEKQLESLEEAQESVSFTATVENRAESERDVCLVLAAYCEGWLLDIKTVKTVILGADSAELTVQGLDISECDTVSAWLIDSFGKRTPLSKEYILK